MSAPEGVEPSTSTVTHQPPAQSEPFVGRPGIKGYFLDTKERFTTKDGWVGDYDFAWLCMPTLPFGKAAAVARNRRPPPFFSLNERLPLVLAIICGLQHALAMLAGLITPPIIFASALNLDGETQAYLISSSLIACGEFFATRYAVMLEADRSAFVQGS